MKFEAVSEYTKISGRTLFRNGIRFLGYSGTSVSFRFYGKKVTAYIISDTEHYEPFERAWAAVFVDDEKEPYKRFEITSVGAEYVLYESDAPKEVTITLMKYSEPEYAPLGVKWFETDSETLLLPPERKQRKIQIVGDSITCGYGVEGSLADEFHRTCTENPMKSYSLLTVAGLDAEAEVVAWNGKGVITEYIGDDREHVEDSWLVPMLYEYTDAGCERDYFHASQDRWEKWEHSSYEPDLVLINLGTNDASYTREIPERNEEFKKAYIVFLTRIHTLHPASKILCMGGTMDQRLCDTIECAVNEFQKNNSDAVIEFLALPPQKEEEGFGTFWHPTEATQRKTADIVIAKAREMMGW